MELALTLNNSYLVEEQERDLTNNLLEEYINQLDNQESTKRTYRNCINDFIKYLTDKGITSPTYETLINYKGYLKQHEEERDGKIVIIKYSSRTINTHITAIKSLYSFLERKGFKNITKGLKRERTFRGFKRTNLTFNQVTKILDSIDKTNLEGARAYALFTLLVNTGLRECEIVRADISDIVNEGNATVLKVKGKGDTEKAERVVIYDYVNDALENYFKLRNAKQDEPLFTSISDRNNGQRLTTRTIQRIITGLYKANGIVSPDITTHSTRHTAITLAVDNGATLIQVKEMARHKDVNTTLIYFHNKERLTNNAEGILNNLFKNREGANN